MVTSQDGQDWTAPPAEDATASLTAHATPPRAKTRTKAGSATALWAAFLVGLLAAALLIVFVLQNQQRTTVTFLGFEGRLPLGMALVISAVSGGILVACVGVVQAVRRGARRRRDKGRTQRS